MFTGFYSARGPECVGFNSLTVREALETLEQGLPLPPGVAQSVAHSFVHGSFDPEQAARFLLAVNEADLSVRTDLLVSLAEAFRAEAVRLDDVPEGLVDTCGTGGGLPTWNISTAAALIVAGAGFPVAKHGNRAVTSKVGSADVLEALGIKLDADPRRCWDKAGIAFLFAPSYHPAFRHVGPVRRSLPVRTIFNYLGPLLNPARVSRQVIGVVDHAAMMANAVERLGAVRVAVVRGLDGYDEFAPIGKTEVFEVSQSFAASRDLSPSDLGLPEAAPEALAPAEDARGNAEKIIKALSDVDSPEAVCVLPTAAVALWAAGATLSLPAGAELAKEAIRSGKALAALHAWREASQLP